MSTTSGGAKPTKSAARAGAAKAAAGAGGRQAGGQSSGAGQPVFAAAPGALAGDLTQGSLVLTPAEGRIAELRLAASDYVQRAIGCELDDSEESLAFVDHYISQVRDGSELRDEVLQLAAAALGVYLGEVTRTRFGGRWVALPPAPDSVATAIIPATAAGPGTPGKGSSAAVTPSSTRVQASVQVAETPILDSIDDPAGWRLQLAAVPLLFDPIGMALQALKPPAEPTEKDDSDRDREGDSDSPAGAKAAADAAGSEDPSGFATTPELAAPLRAALARLPPVTADYYYSLTGRFETLSYVVELLAELQQKEAARRATTDSPRDADADADADADPEDAALS